jgi:ribosomal protein S18 acetylase RimI-like enzyme
MTSPTLRIREATPEDHAFILSLVPELASFGPPPWRDAAEMTAIDERFLREALMGVGIAGAIVLVAEDTDAADAADAAKATAGRPLGFIHLRPQSDYFLQKDCGHVADVIVAPEARGLGVGRALMAAGERWAREHGFEMMTLHVFVENRGARALYEELGFAAEIVRYVKPLR